MSIKGKIKTATSFDEETIDIIKQQFEKLHGEEIEFRHVVDDSIIGGFIVHVGNKVYDRSIKTHLNNLKEFILNDYDNIYTDDGFNGEIFEVNIDMFKNATKDKIFEFEERQTDETVGTVTYSADGVVHVEGLEYCKYGELLQFENNIFGIVLNLELETIGAVLLNSVDGVKQSSTVRKTGNVVQVPVGDGLLGRVLNPIGIAMDGKGKIKSDKYRAIENEAPQIIDRKEVKESLETGIMAIDAMIPIGKGQRELIIGDRQTGKTAIAVDTIINQKGKDVMCVYVAIGQKASTIVTIIRTLEEAGAMDYTVVVASTAADCSPMQYIAPYSGCAIAEEFMNQGKDALIIYDDLSKHAVAYRTMSLLLRRPPGREAYPGDVFYLHSRLLERAAKLSDENGGGSLTALPIIETMSGDISAYIPTNVISITDGQIYLETELFNAGVRPAINVGLSVSRVGGSAQTKAIKSVAHRLRIDLAQFRELAVFAQFSSDLDSETQKSLAHGVRLTESLKQAQYQPTPLASQVITLFAVTNRLLKSIPVEHITNVIKEIIEYVDANHPQVRTDIEKTEELSKESEEALTYGINEFVPTYLDRNNLKPADEDDH